MVSCPAEAFPDRELAARAAMAFIALLTEMRQALEQLPNSADAPALDRLEDIALRQMALVQRGEQLAAQLRAYAGRQQLKPVRLELLPFMANLVHTLRGVVDARIDVTVNVGHDCPTCEVDAEALEEALLGLIRNALDAMPDGGRLHFSAQADLPSDRRHGDPTVALSVADSGTRMRPQHVRRAALASATGKANDPVAEMALAAVDGFARQSGGWMTLQNICGAMSATLHLPQVGSLRTTPAEIESPLAMLNIGETHLRGMVDSASDAILTTDASRSW